MALAVFGGWLLTRTRRALIAEVEGFTLAHFRAEGQSKGAVDFLALRDELGQGLDGYLVERVQSTSSQTSRLLAALAVALACACTLAIHQYL